MKDTPKVKLIPIKQIFPNPYQPRTHFDAVGLGELADSIRRYGVLSPIAVRYAGNSYELISGERRLRAAGIAGLAEIPAIVMNVNDEESALIALVENLQRRDLNFFEEAESINSLISCHRLTQSEIAERLAKSQAAIANKLRLLRLDERLRTQILEHHLSERHARALLRIPDFDLQQQVLDKVVADNLTVAATERLVQAELNELVEEKYAFTPRMAPSPQKNIVYLNTIAKTVDMICKSGAAATTKQVEYEDYIEYIIRLEKA